MPDALDGKFRVADNFAVARPVGGDEKPAGRWWPLIAALTFVVLFVGSQFVVPTPPDAEASGQNVVRYFQANADGIRLATWLLAISTFPYVLGGGVAAEPGRRHGS